MAFVPFRARISVVSRFRIGCTALVLGFTRSLPLRYRRTLNPSMLITPYVLVGASPGRCGFVRYALGEVVDRGDVDHCFGAGGRGVVIAGESAPPSGSAHGSFY